MAKNWTDAEFEVVGRREFEVVGRRAELPTWFKVTMLLLVAAYLLAMGVWKVGELHPTGPQAAAGVTAAPPAPPAPQP